MENNEWNPQYVYERMVSEMDEIKETLSKLDELIQLHPDYEKHIKTAKKYCNGQLNKFYNRIQKWLQKNFKQI